MSRVELRPPRGVAPLLCAAVVVVLVALGAARGLWLANLHNGLLALVCSAVGGYVVWQRPGHRVGVLLLAAGLVEALMFAGRQAGHAAGPDTSPWFVWAGVWPLAAGLALTTLAVLLFPDGHLPSPRWRPVAAAVVVVGGLCALTSAIWPVEYASVGISVRHPVHATAPSAVAGVWDAVAHPAYAAFQVLWVVAIVVRWRAAGPQARVQLVWLVSAAALSVVALLVGLVAAGSPRAGVLAAALVPAAAGVAIVHGQHLASYRALTWLSRAPAGVRGLPDEFAATAARALGASHASLWIGGADELHAVGVWPRDGATPAPVSLDELHAGRGQIVRRVVRDGDLLGALSLGGARLGTLSRAQSRLLADLAGQAALVLDHLDLAGLVESERQARRLEGLTDREREVLELMAQGLSNAAIAEHLHLSIKTVEPVVGAIFAKLGLGTETGRNRRVLAVLAYLRA